MINGLKLATFKMKAIILVGGEGTRLRPLTYNTPKAMMPILNIPFIHHLILYLKHYGINKVILSMGYKPDSIREYFNKVKLKGIEIIYNIESKPLGTAGAVKYAQHYLNKNETFFVLNGDIFTDINLSDMLNFHKARGAKLTIALTKVEDPSLFGVVEIDKDQKIKRFIEKPKKEETPSNLINAGIYLMDYSILERIPDDEFFMFERSVFPQLLPEGAPVMGFKTDSYWIDMGNPQKYHQLNNDLLLGKCQQISTKRSGIHKNAKVHPKAKVKLPSLIDAGSNIREYAMLDTSIVGSNCEINDSCQIEHSIIWSNVRIGKNTRIKNSIIANRCVIEDNIVLDNEVICTPNNSESGGLKKINVSKYFPCK